MKLFALVLLPLVVSTSFMHAASLHDAVVQNNVIKIKEALKKGEYIDARGDHNRTPLYQAIASGNVAAAKCLLKHGAEPDHADDYNYTPLHYAVQYAHVSRGDFSSEAEKEEFAAAKAARMKAIARCLLKHGANHAKRDKSRGPDVLGRAAISIAANLGLPAMIPLLREWGADPNIRSGKAHLTPLMLAALGGHADAVQSLLDSGADIHALSKEEEGRSALRFAVIADKTEAAKALLDRGALRRSLFEDPDPNLLCRAAINGNIEIGNELLMRGMRVDVRDKYGMTPLLYAARHGKGAFITWLLDNGADLNLTRTEDENGPMHLAAAFGQKSTLEQLGRLGCDKNAKNKYDQTPLALATLKGQTDVVNYLLSISAT